MKRFAVCAALLLSSLASLASAAEPYRTESIVLLQPDHVLKQRVASVPALSGYIKAVQSAVEDALADEPPHPAGGYLVLAVRPGGHAMVWLDVTPGLSQATAARLRSAILAVPAFEARGGVVVFALRASLWGGAVTSDFPNPQEWSQAMQGRSAPMEIGELVDTVWPGPDP